MTALTDRDIAARLAGPDAELDDALTRLHGRLADTAAREGVLDVAYTVADSPVGRLLLAATDRGLVRIAYEVEGHEAVLTTLASRVSPRVLEAPARLASVERQLDAYFAGRLTRFDLPLDFTLVRGFRGTVQRHLVEIPYGRTESYAQIAREVGNPRAVRAVGSACATNPLPLVLPCHRVLRSDGTLGGYAGGPGTKAALLRLESAA